MCKREHLTASCYGTPDSCWQRVDNHFILTFTAATVVCTNLGFLRYTFCTMIFHMFNASTMDV